MTPQNKNIFGNTLLDVRQQFQHRQVISYLQSHNH